VLAVIIIIIGKCTGKFKSSFGRLDVDEVDEEEEEEEELEEEELEEEKEEETERKKRKKRNVENQQLALAGKLQKLANELSECN